MEYSKFLDYAFPAFGICTLVALACWLPIQFVKKEAPAWLAGLLLIGLFLSVSGMLLIGWFLPWGSPF